MLNDGSLRTSPLTRNSSNLKKKKTHDDFDDEVVIVGQADIPNIVDSEKTNHPKDMKADLPQMIRKLQGTKDARAGEQNLVSGQKSRKKESKRARFGVTMYVEKDLTLAPLLE